MGAPTVRRRRLGAELRRLREAAGLKLDDVQERTSINAVKASRVETARTGVKPADLDTLLDLYGVDDVAKRSLLHALARDGARRGWWQTYADTISPAYADLISLEAQARNIRTWQTTLIPGLLQTAGYARATIDAINMTTPPDRVNALVEVRTARQSVLTRPDPPELWAIVHEVALRPQLADTHVMREQLQRLLDVTELPHVSVQVLPLTASPHPGMAGPFTLLGFPETADLDIAHVEDLTSALYVEDPAEVSIYGSAFERLRAAALPFDKTTDLIAQLKDAL
ncbi:helix-turn-helix transcriptional regulator [Streptomyces xanthochromogenes]|uniref:helix-turn-helix domain-containing protein n=1 Tax=Streptomyces xanthochromogenes TaxID=67384 RepID=UPI0034267DE7